VKVALTACLRGLLADELDAVEEMAVALGKTGETDRLLEVQMT
jgi:hypothetical protein